MFRATSCFVTVAALLLAFAIWPGIARAEKLNERLIAGLDGGWYEQYQPKVIERIQHALKARSLYDGPINGILDKTTMKAIFLFQRMSGTLQVCGVPTPRTRKLLQQGSHTDPL